MKNERHQLIGYEQLAELLAAFHRDFNTFLNDFHKFSESVLSELQRLQETIAAAGSHPRRAQKQLREESPDFDFLTQIARLPNYLQKTYTYVVDHAPITAHDLIKQFGYSHATASKHLKELAEAHELLDYRRGDKTKDENAHQLYYFPMHRESV